MAAGLSARGRAPSDRRARRLQARRPRDGLTRNPASAELVDRPTVRYSGEFVTFDADELAALARAAHDEQDAALYLAAAMTGLR